MNSTVTATARYVEVEVDLDDLHLDDLEEYVRAKRGGDADSVVKVALSDVYLALKFGNEQRALELMRGYVQDELGVIL